MELSIASLLQTDCKLLKVVRYVWKLDYISEL